MAHPQFGWMVDPGGDSIPILADPNNLFNQVLAKTKPMELMQAKELLAEAYDTTFGIFNHLRQAQIEEKSADPALKRPLALVALHPAEDWAGRHSQLELILRGFADNAVAEHFNISLPEFLDLPVEMAERLMRISKSIMQRKSHDNEAARSQIETAAAGRGRNN